MRRVGGLIAAGLAFALPAFAFADGPNPKALDWLVGRWTAEKTADGAAGGFSFEREAGGKVIVRHNHADYPASGARPASHHDDLMVVYFDGPLRADYWDNEGHTIHYTGAVSEDGRVIFTDTAASGPHYRLTYKPQGAQGLSGQFEVEPPGEAAFKSYLTWTAVRVP